MSPYRNLTLMCFICILIKGSAKGDWVEVVQQVQLKQGYNELMLLSQTVGLQVLNKSYNGPSQVWVVKNINIINAKVFGFDPFLFQRKFFG